MTAVRWGVAFLVSLTLACTDVLPVPELKTEQFLVANAFFTPDTTWQVQLSTSVPLDQITAIKPIENAIVRIRDLASNKVTTLQHQKEGYYASIQERPTATTKYELSVQAEGFDFLQAINQTPALFKASVQAYDTLTYRNTVGYSFDLLIEDIATETNYYLINRRK